MKLVIRIALVCALMTMMALPAMATVITYQLQSHPLGAELPPPYGLRLDDLLGAGTGKFTFDFDFDDGNEQADVKLEYDDVAMTVRIFGRAYGGKDIGTQYDAAIQGWADFDFTYRMNVTMVDDESLAPGNDVYVTAEDPMNNGSITLDGWGGDITLNLTDKERAGANPYSFRFDNDRDRDAIIADNPMLVGGAGWLMINGEDRAGAQDWLFFAEAPAPTSVEDSSFGAIKSLYR